MPPKPTHALEETIVASIAALTDKISERQSDFEHRHEVLTTVVTDLQAQLSLRPTNSASPSTSQPPPPPPQSPTAYTTPFLHAPPRAPALPQLKPPKIHLPQFDGSSPLDWIFQAEQYFQFYQVPPENRLDLIGFYMAGDALSWFKWMFSNRQLSSWEAFVRALEVRFGPSSYENHQAALFKLRQTSSVTDYQAHFEKICNRVIGLSPEAILNCFISACVKIFNVS